MSVRCQIKKPERDPSGITHHIETATHVKYFLPIWRDLGIARKFKIKDITGLQRLLANFRRDGQIHAQDGKSSSEH